MVIGIPCGLILGGGQLGDDEGESQVEGEGEDEGRYFVCRNLFGRVHFEIQTVAMSCVSVSLCR